MFVAKFKLYHSDCPIVNRCVKFKTNIFSYPGHHYRVSGKQFASTFCKFETQDESIQKRFITDLKKDPHLARLDVWGNNFLYTFELGQRGEHVMLYLNNAMAFIRPTLNSMDGHEYWEIASGDKQFIKNSYKNLKKHMTSAELVYIRQEKNIDIAFPLLTKKLSRMQVKAIKLAVERGYYSFPRKAHLEDLAKELKTTIPTIQEHLRKAEEKIINERLIL